MKNRIVAALLIAMSAVCLAASDTPMTIKTLDGQTFENAVVEGVHPGGIDIGYVNANGDYVLKGLSFKILPEDIQKQFGYDPAANAQFEAQVKAHEQDDPGKVVEAEKDRLERVTKEIQAKFAGQNIKIKPEDMRFAIYAKRLSVILDPVSSSLSGCVAKIVEVESGGAISAPFIQIDSAALPTDVNWSGFIYPTGLKARYQGNDIPVYADSLDRAVVLVDHYLDIYSEYAAEGANQPQTGAAAPPDQDPAAPQTQQPQAQPDQTAQQQQAQQDQAAAQQQQDQQQNYSSNDDGGYYPGYSYAYGPGYYGGGCYYIGPNYNPVYWWNRRHYPYPYHPVYNPHRPNPPDGPRPGHGGDRPGQGGNRPGHGGNQPGPGGYHPGTIMQPSAFGVGERPSASPYAPLPGSGASYLQPGGARPYYQQTNHTQTHSIQRAGNFRRAVPVNRGGEERGGEGMSRGFEGGGRGGMGGGGFRR